MAARKRKPARNVAEPIALYDAKTHLSQLVDEAAAGREFTIAKSGKPMARLVPLIAPDLRALRKPGGGKGRVWIARNFDAPLPPAMMRLFSEENE
jgi:prevent-host-death family protein